MSERYVLKQNKKPVDKIIQLPLAKLIGMAEHCVCNVPGDSLAPSALQAPHKSSQVKAAAGSAVWVSPSSTPGWFENTGEEYLAKIKLTSSGLRATEESNFGNNYNDLLRKSY